jgi:hypothetical protein
MRAISDMFVLEIPIHSVALFLGAGALSVKV